MLALWVNQLYLGPLKLDATSELRKKEYAHTHGKSYSFLVSYNIAFSGLFSSVNVRY